MTDYKDRVSGWATDIDWSRAPGGATHGREVVGHTPDFYRIHMGNLQYWCEDTEMWKPCGCRSINDDDMIPRPAPQWNGEGLPPVGTFVRITDDGSLRYGSSESGEVIAHVEDCAVVRMSYGLGCFTARYLEAIKTPAQIAAEEREAGIHKMLLAVNPVGHLPRYTYQVVSCLYDAGLRFPKGDDQ